MSRLRRLVLCDRYFFVTCKVLPQRERLSEADFALLADSVQSRRTHHHFLLTAWVFLPDHWHAIVMPPYPSTISGVMESIKVSSPDKTSSEETRGFFGKGDSSTELCEP